MKNITPYKGNCIDFYRSIVKTKRNSKENPDYKTLLSSLDAKIKSQYDTFDTKFSANLLEDLTPHVFSGDEKSALLKLYAYKSKVISKFKVDITTDASKRIISTCQNCTIGEINSFDHFIPKKEFAEFVINPKNLFPSCTKCNGYKSTAWRKLGKRIFLNLYLDVLPIQQYLFLDIDKKSGGTNFRFYLDNPSGISTEMYELIKNHYNNLHLCQRFRENSDIVVSELDISIRNNLAVSSLEKICEIGIRGQEEGKKLYGHNYWKSILQISLLNNASFLDRFK